MHKAGAAAACEHHDDSFMLFYIYAVHLHWQTMTDRGYVGLYTILLESAGTAA